jgi:EAL domain-containing protein (putative c-di-GMP-specific phosphodiesterase class I)
MAKNKRKSNRDPLPDDFGSWEAAAEFWDTHDLTDYEDTERDVPDVQINLVPHHFRVDAAIAQRFHQLAHRRGISPETLVNLWLAEKLRLATTATTAKRNHNKKVRGSRVANPV